MDRQLINYLPPFVQEYQEVKAIMDAEQFVFEKGWTDTENVFNDQYIQNATENGISRYEKILGITPKGTYTLDDRRFNVLARMNEQLPYTLESLKNSLTSLCGKGGYSIRLDADKYELTVKLALANENSVAAVNLLLDKMLPANIVKKVMLFNTYAILGDFTHEQLSEYTHNELRTEIL